MAGSQAQHFPPGFLRRFFFIIWDHHLALPLHLGCCPTVFVLVSGCICDAREILQGGLERSGPDSHWGQVSQWSRAQQHLCCCCSVFKSCPTPWTAAPGFPVLHYFLKFAQTHVHGVGNAIQPSLSLSSPSLPAFNLSQHQGLFQWAWSLHQVAKGLELQLQHPSSEQSGLISFRIDGFHLLALEGTLESLLQHHHLN